MKDEISSPCNTGKLLMWTDFQKKSFIKKLRRSDLGLHHHPFSPGDSKVLLNVAAFQENLYFREM